jgi:hypothetical protein
MSSVLLEVAGNKGMRSTRRRMRRILLNIIIVLAVLALPLLLPRGCGPVLHSNGLTAPD